MDALLHTDFFTLWPSAGVNPPHSHQPPLPGGSTPWCGSRVPPTHFQDLLSLPFLLISTPLCQLLVCRNTFYQGPPSARWAEMHNSFSEPTSEKFLAVAGN